MSIGDKRFCTITFMDSKTMRFTFAAVKDENDPSMGKAIQDIAASQNLLFEIEGKLVLIPMNNVRTVEVSPAPAHLPRTIPRAKMLEY